VVVGWDAPSQEASHILRKLLTTLDKNLFVCYIIPMMSEIEQTKEDMAMKLFGRSRTIALAGNECVKCGEFNLEFRDEISRREYGISALCQCCQDGIFGE
jgi:chemotaxis receptor (MCP) glutamine deamidase CheD